MSTLYLLVGQLKPVRNSYVTIMHRSITVSSNTCSQMHAQIKRSLAHLQDLIPTLGGVFHTS